MTDEHEEAIEAFLRAFDARLAAAPLVERRRQAAVAPAERIIEARRAVGPGDPGDQDFAYWESDVS